jgi:hypothetical protein
VTFVATASDSYFHHGFVVKPSAGTSLWRGSSTIETHLQSKDLTICHVHRGFTTYLSYQCRHPSVRSLLAKP